MKTLSEAKVGDKVIYQTTSKDEVVEVLRVTPTGRIKVKRPDSVCYIDTFDSSGALFGGDRYVRYSRRLAVVTPERLQKIQNWKDLNKIASINWNCVSPEKIRAALKAIE